MQPWIEACHELARAGVRYVVIGAFGINVHAGPRGPVVATGDCDLLLPAHSEPLGKAVAALRGLGYSIEAGGEPLPDEDPVVLRGIVRARACVRASRGASRIDLPLEMSGCTFEVLWSRRRSFTVQGVTVHVAPLGDIVRSKQLADRPKDRATLEALRSELEELLERELADLAAEWRESGNPDAGASFLRRRLQDGAINLSQLRLAAYLGGPCSNHLLGSDAPEPPAVFSEWLAGLADWGPEVEVRAALAALRHIATALSFGGSASAVLEVGGLRRAISYSLASWCLGYDG